MTSTGSHLIGTYPYLAFRPIPGGRDSRAELTLAAEKISLTDWEISGPIPSPSISVTVYFPWCQKRQSSFSLACPTFGREGREASGMGYAHQIPWFLGIWRLSGPQEQHSTEPVQLN